MFGRKGKTTILVVGLVLCLASLANADLAGRINSVIQRKSVKKARFAVHIVDAQTGMTAYSHNARQKMLPASNMKIITSAAALHYLGPEYTFRTKVGLMKDSLVVIGAGDPLLGDMKTDEKHGRKNDWVFTDIAEALQKNGVTALKNIIIDRTFFDDNRVHPSWPLEQLNNWYACEVSGLNYNDNCVKITVTRTGTSVIPQVEPETEYVKLINEVKGITKGNSAVGAYRNSQPNVLIIRGKCNKAAGFDVAIENPGAFFGFMLAENLNQTGITVQGSLVEKYITDRHEIKILRFYSTSLADVLTRCNKNSLGLAAEALVKTISAENTKGKINGEWKHGLELIARYLEQMGIEREEFNLDDGSGLSRMNRLTPNVLTTVLLSVYNSKSWKLYMDSLAVGGQDGTIAKYFKDTKYKGRISGKTGYISGARSFSGICQTSKGDYIVSVLTEGGDGQVRSAINDIIKAIIDNAG
jgi:D-alanyl-D-alanine carboxypeptidase/D-alanyl-D-alanine-endopeptidase (penicillin-binding protein 4)